MAECTFDGSGSFVGFTVEKLLDCSTSIPSGTQDLIVIHTVSRVTAAASLFLVQKDADEWRMDIDQFESPRTTDGAGGWTNMRFGHQIKHGEIAVNFEWPWEQDFNLSLMLGAEGTLRKHGSDGSHWTGKAKLVSAPGQPAVAVGELSVGSLSWRWLGGENPPVYSATP